MTQSAAKPYVHTHVMRVWSALYDRCIWCGHYERRAPIVDDVPLEIPVVTDEYVPATLAATAAERIATAFRLMARKHCAQSDALQQWQQQGNPLPKVYRE